jgi:pantoate--beta-alanine ligase
MSLRIVRSVADLRAALEPARRAGRRIGLVPTMGAFHDGHRSLMERAAATCDVVVVSLFVNPTQFGPSEDLSAYPRDEARDAAIAAGAGVDLLFAPPVEEVYPDGFATSVSVGGLTDGLEGAHRPGHFDGVATVVAKLLNMVQPTVAFFGQKDAQQALVIRRLVRDLNLPVRVEVCPTVREADGLAMSSRNAYLGAEDRARAVGLSRALDAAAAAIAAGERDAERVAATGRAVLAEHGIEAEYFALVSEETLAPVATIDGGAVLLAVAARVGPARLIDNVLVTIPNGVPERA